MRKFDFPSVNEQFFLFTFYVFIFLRLFLLLLLQLENYLNAIQFLFSFFRLFSMNFFSLLFSMSFFCFYYFREQKKREYQSEILAIVWQIKWTLFSDSDFLLTMRSPINHERSIYLSAFSVWTRALQLGPISNCSVCAVCAACIYNQDFFSADMIFIPCDFFFMTKLHCSDQACCDNCLSASVNCTESNKVQIISYKVAYYICSISILKSCLVSTHSSHE